jgi:tripartite-type tricarboxylate transporter receptor subunit TctC
MQSFGEFLMRRFLCGVLCALSSGALLAQEYPTKTVKIVVPFAVGGPADIYARAVAKLLSESTGQSFFVENKPGGGAVLGTDAAAKSPADGYTLLMMSNAQTVNETLIPNKPYALLRDFVPVAPVNYSDLVLVAHPSLAATNVRELLALAKQKPKDITFASSGPGTPYHMAGELLKSMAGVDMLHVPYKGSSGARTDIVAGHVNVMFDAITTMAVQAKAGKVKALATSGKTRSSVMPDVPTLDEAGVAGYESVIWLGIMAPANTPRAIVNKLNAEIAKAVSRPEVKAEWAKQGATSMQMSPEAFAKYTRDDIEKWAHVVKVSGAKFDE